MLLKPLEVPMENTAQTINVGDIWVDKKNETRYALVVKVHDWKAQGGKANRIECLYFGGHHPEGGDTAIPPRHIFLRCFEPII